MRKSTLTKTSTALLFFALLLSLYHCQPVAETPPTAQRPAEEPQQEKREEWLALMHRSAPGTNWQQIEQQNQIRYRSPAPLALRSECGITSFANGQVSGKWMERGSRNQAGSLLDITYVAATDQIWGIAAGGSLWRRSRQSNNWQVINQQVRLDRGFLEIISHKNQPRILAFINNWLHYSDDQGLSWKGTNVQKLVSDYGGYFGHPVLSQGPRRIIAYLSKPSYWSDLQLVYSTDNGEHIGALELLDDHELDNFELVALPDSDEVWLLQRAATGSLQLYRVDFDNNNLIRLNPGSQHSAGINPLEATFGRKADSLALYTYLKSADSQSSSYYYSTTQGRNWTKLAELPTDPWPSTLHISDKDPNIHYIGAVDAYRSTNGGQSWQPINYWWEYYEDTNRYLHADIMDVQDFYDPDGQHFTLISNHGGLNISYDEFKNANNLGLEALNISQYYSVRSHPDDPSLIYAGSQDQGLQATIDEQPDSALHFDQLVGGDYGHLAFTADGQSLWAVYPDGLVFFVEDVQTGFVNTSYELDSEHETVWLPPLHAGHSLTEKTAILAGGNPEGDQGSYLIELTYEDGQIKAQKGNFDFLAEAVDGTISAIEVAPGDSTYRYVATTNGRFFYTHNAGKDWQQSLEFLPTGNYLYGQAVLASAKNPKQVYLAGSGYSNPPVLYSKDGGRTFVDKSEGLPPTLIYDLAMNTEETLLFAASEAGPFVYIVAEETWYYLGNACTPNQSYWSVEYLPSIDRVRFGTYGRGIWDLHLDQISTSTQSELPQANIAIDVFPNPSSDFILIRTKWQGNYQIINQAGQIMESGNLNSQPQRVNLSDWPSGVYYLQVDNPSIWAQKIIVQ